MPSPAAPVQKKKLPLVKLGIALVLLAAGAVLVLRGLDVRGLVQAFMDEIRTQGPLVFFAALALLPAVGFPVLAFDLTASTAFSERMGMPAVVACVLVAVTINFSLTYVLARRWLRPVLEKLLTRFGYKVPKVEEGDETDLIMILRLTPGIPFFVQNYLCGLAEVKFRRYFLLSCLLAWPFNAATVIFSDAVIHGKGRMAITTGMLLVAVAAATHLARKHYAKKQKPPA